MSILTRAINMFIAFIGQILWLMVLIDYQTATTLTSLEISFGKKIKYETSFTSVETKGSFGFRSHSTLH